MPINFEARDIVEAMEGITLREKIARLEAALNACPPETIREIVPIHHFSEGVYMREVLLPQGTLAVGRIHRHSCLAMIVGDVSIMSEQGPMRVQGMRVFLSVPGAKRVAYAHSPTRWVTVHATKERNIETLEAELFAPSFEELGIMELDGVDVLTGGF